MGSGQYSQLEKKLISFVGAFSPGKKKGKGYLPNVAAAAKSLQLCLTLCDLMECNPTGSSVHGILQA